MLVVSSVFCFCYVLVVSIMFCEVSIVSNVCCSYDMLVTSNAIACVMCQC